MGLTMDDNLQGIIDLAGVNAAMILDGAGRVLGHRGKAVYDRALCEHVGGMLAKAVDSISLQNEGWEAATAQYADGTILLRNIGKVAGAGYVLAVVADATLNPAFAAVALRVASNKAKKAIEIGAGMAPSASGVSASGVSASGVSAPGASASSVGAVPARPSSSQVLGATPHPASGSRPSLSNSGLSWSRVGGSGVSGVTAADPASSAFLTRCSKALARYVGPMAKVYVEEAVRRICPDAPFTLAQGRALCDDLAGQVEDSKDRAAFLKAVEASG
jgi:hypothetical protein